MYCELKKSAPRLISYPVSTNRFLICDSVTTGLNALKNLDQTLTSLSLVGMNFINPSPKSQL